MSISKKGSRKIEVDGVLYRWRVSRYRYVSDWRSETELLDENYIKIAANYGLGTVADIVFNVPIELYDQPVSKIDVKYFGLAVDGFLGPEQMVSIKPAVIASVIKHCLNEAWRPTQKGNYQVEIYENSGEKHRPAILVLPTMNNNVTDYSHLVKPINLI